jgi:hypothetical protein
LLFRLLFAHKTMISRVPGVSTGHQANCLLACYGDTGWLPLSPL